MQTYASKTNEKQSSVVIRNEQKKDSTFQLENNRCEIMQMNKLQEFANNNTRNQELVQLQRISNGHVIQRILNAHDVEAKADQFLVAHNQEKQLIIEANALLGAFSENATPTTFNSLNVRFSAIRDAISVQTNIQADLVQEYIDTNDEAIRKVFMDRVLERDSAVLKPLFNTLINQTQLGANVDAAYKRRFLSYVLQSMKFPSGEGRFVELMGLLGGKNIEINELLLGPSAGLRNPGNNPMAEKMDRRNSADDMNLLELHDGNLSEFIKNRFATPPYVRTPNPAVAGIGDVAVNMERNQTVFPIYYGHTATKDVQAFTSPMFTAIHHELGHVVNKLKGTAGVYDDRYRPNENGLLRLTDEEEVYNISIDQYSDKAMSADLGLPERIAHGAFGGLDAANTNLDKGVMEDQLRNWDDWTYQLTPERNIALRYIKQIADGNWAAYTQYGSKPSGVNKIMKALASLNNMGYGMKKQLEEVRRIAQGSLAKASKNRNVRTTKFYEILNGMNVDTKDGLEMLNIQLEVLIDMGNF